MKKPTHWLAALACSLCLAGSASALEIIIYAPDSFSLNTLPNPSSQRESFSVSGIDIYLLPVSGADFVSGRTSVSAGDRYTNVDTTYLLQNIEGYAGLATLASNLIVAPESDSEVALLQTLFAGLAGILSAAQLTTWEVPIKSLWLVNERDLTVAPTPEPTTLFLLGSGLVGLAGYGRKRKK